MEGHDGGVVCESAERMWRVGPEGHVCVCVCGT